MEFRIAVEQDIPGIQVVRNLVKENRLSNPGLVTDKDVHDYINLRGRGWVAVQDEKITGFSIVSVADNNVWALFVDPLFEQKGIGSRLHDLMLEWYFGKTATPLWLSTSPRTRAETFYRMKGWQETGVTASGETRFEMTAAIWQMKRS